MAVINVGAKVLLQGVTLSLCLPNALRLVHRAHALLYLEVSAKHLLKYEFSYGLPSETMLLRNTISPGTSFLAKRSVKPGRRSCL
jgi:hypothetical protein